MPVGVKYVTEREALAIRGMELTGWTHNHCNMTIEIIDGKDTISIPQETVMQYWHDWQASGLWSLPGLKEQTP